MPRLEESLQTATILNDPPGVYFRHVTLPSSNEAMIFPASIASPLNASLDAQSWANTGVGMLQMAHRCHRVDH